MYEELKKYSSLNYADLIRGSGDAFGVNGGAHEDFVTYLDKMTNFQRFVTSKEGNEEAGEIAIRAKSVFGDSNVAEAYCADLHMLDKLDMLLEYSESVRDLFNYIVPLITYNGIVTNETEQEIRLILEAKGLGDFKVPEHLLVTNE